MCLPLLLVRPATFVWLAIIILTLRSVSTVSRIRFKNTISTTNRYDLPEKNNTNGHIHTRINEWSFERTLVRKAAR